MCVDLYAMSRAGYEPASLQSGIKQMIYPVVASFPIGPPTLVNILSLKNDKGCGSDVVSDVM